MKNSILSIIVVVLLVGAGGFFAGMKYQSTKPSQMGSSGRFGNGQFQQRGVRSGMRPVAGEIISIDDKSIAVKLRDGSSKIIILSDKTSVNKVAEASRKDMKTGEQIVVFGTDNADGSVTAQNIQLNPMFGAMVGNRTQGSK